MSEFNRGISARGGRDYDQLYDDNPMPVVSDEQRQRAREVLGWYAKDDTDREMLTEMLGLS